jgi:hypothetical protein
MTRTGTVRLSLSVESVNYLIIFFFHNKSVNSIFNYDFLNK